MPSYEDYPEAPDDLEPTLGFVCPLYRELAAVRAIFDQQFKPKPKYQDGDLECEYHYGRIASRDVVAVSFADKRVGPRWAVAHAERLLERHPSLKDDTSSFFLVGIAAGIPSKDEDIRLGDVVIATQVVDWTDGKKKTGDEFESTEHAESASNHVLNKVAGFCDNEKRLGERIQEMVETMQPLKPEDKVLWRCPGDDQDILFRPDVIHKDGEACENCEQRFEERKPREPCLPKVHRGLIAAGNIVLKDAATREMLRQYERNKVLAVEMEASGVMTASKRFIIIRGICDYGDSHKNKQWQHYAAANAAACARLWISDCLPGTNLKKRETAGREDSDSLSSVETGVSRGSNESENGSNKSSRPVSPSPPEGEADTKPVSKVNTQTQDFAPQANSSNNEWTTLENFKASVVEISLRNGIEEKDKETEWTSVKHKEVGLRFEVQMEQPACKGTRRLLIVPSAGGKDSHRTVWIPNTQVRVTRQGEKLKVKFSNCNQVVKQKFGRFDTQQGRAKYTTRYNPETPNVHIEISMSNDEEAMGLSELFLCRHRHFLPNVGRLQYNPHGYTTAHCPGSNQVDAVYVWHKGKDDEVLDLASFSDKMDFEIYVNELTYILLGYMDKFAYEPTTDEEYPSWGKLPKAVRENHDGSPGSVGFTGGESLSNTLDMVASNEDEIGKLLTETVGNHVQWTMKALALDVDIAFARNSKLKGSVQIGPSQVSAWANGKDVRFLVNTAKTAKQDKPRWMSGTIPLANLDQGSSDDGPGFSVEGDQEAVLQFADFQAGDYLSPTTFLPEGETGSKKTNGSDWKAMKLKFDSAGSRRRFEQSLSSGTMEASQT